MNKVIYISDTSTYANATLTITEWKKNTFQIEIDSPFCGDSERGIGNTLNINFSLQKLAEMYEAIGRRIKKEKGE